MLYPALLPVMHTPRLPVASTLHTTSEHVVSSIITADGAHLGCQQSTELTPPPPCPGRFKWTRPFRRQTKSDFCACAITYQTQSTPGSRSARSQILRQSARGGGKVVSPTLRSSLPPRKYSCYSSLLGTAVAQCLRYCATNRKVADSIPAVVIGILHSHNPSGRTMALGSTQPLTEMSTRNISLGVKAAGA